METTGTVLAAKISGIPQQFLLFDAALMFENVVQSDGYRLCLRLNKSIPKNLYDGLKDAAQEYKRVIVLDPADHSAFPSWTSKDDVWVDGYWAINELDTLIYAGDNIEYSNKKYGDKDFSEEQKKTCELYIKLFSINFAGIEKLEKELSKDLNEYISSKRSCTEGRCNEC